MEIKDSPKLNLPQEIFLRIFSYLEARSLASKNSLVSHFWNKLSINKGLWKVVLKKEKNLFYRHKETATMGWKYRQLSIHFCNLNRFEIAILICQKAVLFSHVEAAYGFSDLCQKACDAKNYEIARKCQDLAKKHDPQAGKVALRYLLESQVKDLNSKGKCLVE